MPFRYRSAAVLICVASLLTAQDKGDIRTLEWAQLPEPAKLLAAQLKLDASNFKQTLLQIDQRTAQRLREGDWDHLIFYLLQSKSFTPLDPIEPTLSAIQYKNGQQVPAAVRARIESFLKAIPKTSANERLHHFSTLVPMRDAVSELESQYKRVMKFLYEKEVRCRDRDHPQACVADLYSDRGLSVDTSQQSFRTVEAAVAWIRETQPNLNLNRVLIIGPGLDLAPRTALREDSEPQVYQPLQAASVLRPERVDCTDINPLVIAYARKSCQSAFQMNIATQFVDQRPGWDLIIATNVLLYLDDRELLLAMNNLRRMLSPQGILVHNDARFAVNVFGKASGLPVIHFGEIVLDGQRKPPLTDRMVIHQIGSPRL